MEKKTTIKKAVQKVKKPNIRANKTNTLKKATLDALEKSLGIVTTATKSVGINRSTFYDWYNDDEKFRNGVDDIKEIAKDFVESQLYGQIKDGNTTATIFYMKCKMRERGYIEKTDVNIKSGSPDLSDMSTEEIREHLKNG